MEAGQLFRKRYGENADVIQYIFHSFADLTHDCSSCSGFRVGDWAAAADKDEEDNSYEEEENDVDYIGLNGNNYIQVL
ncbi:Hypothetical predicted protein [Octopus vulgaris]|uniref:Uncharacterized protein n=1 Tax=Octopus vulgaris TaxID=6645 RepID=A0AA36EWU4_OCTVU|nr:Hypothetical predicted protein [Octopus vulgaris]